MLDNPLAIITILISVEAVVLTATSLPGMRGLFSFLPPLFWIYFLPMLASSSGLIPNQHPVYEFLTSTFLPAGLILILLPVDLRNIARLGKQSLVMMLSGSLGIVVAAPTVLFFFRYYLPQDIWKGFGALSGSWIGGSSNMLAIKEAVGTPEDIFFLMIIMDTVVVYTWMAFLIALSRWQEKFDRWNSSRVDLMDMVARQISLGQKQNLSPDVTHSSAIWALGMAGAWICSSLAQGLPEIRNVIASFTWTIIFATVLGILLSETGMRKLESYGASRTGYSMLFLVLASIGARGNLSRISQAPLLVLIGFIWVLLHFGILLLTARLIKAPLCLVATASQANLGGPASAPVVAEAYRPGTAPVGVLMAVLGLLIGTILGLFCTQICRLVCVF